MLATRVFCAAVPVLLCALLVPSALTKAQQTALSKGERDRNRQILNDAYDAVKEHYYDRNYHGVDLKALHSEYATKVEESESNGQAFRMIAAFLGKLNDSHTFFIPPLRPYSFDYGYRMQMIGDRCFVTAVRPGTDAEAKAHVGDQVLNLDGYSVNRTDFRALSYYLGELAPQPMSSLDLLTPGGQKEAVRITVKFEKKQEVIDAFGPWRWAKQVDGSRQVVVGDATFWKMPIFLANDSTVDHLFSSARQHKTLILDLRGNPGGAGGTLERMLGYVFDHDVKIGDRITRTEKRPMVAKSRGGHVFSGNLIVLIDAQSASAAELFARVVQLEKRGVVLGDRSSGMVMEAQIYPYTQGLANVVAYAIEVTEADLTMTDGKSLEGNGVVPDEIILPTAQDLAAGRDPVLARAAQLAHVKLDPVEAGEMFPVEWAPL
ncbi:MAG TPA: S41 family peptidase [Candidatus Acidoferrales bacterium]